jgi:hypothetical protein
MKSCSNCRFWSQMVAQSIGCGPIEALCLCSGRHGDGPHHGKYVKADHVCVAHKSDHFGKVDDPPNYGELSRAAYEAEEKGET